MKILNDQFCVQYEKLISITMLTYWIIKLTLFFLLLQKSQQQNILSTIFAADQIILWNGNTIFQHPFSIISYQFNYTFNSPPYDIVKIFAIFNGYHLINQNYLSFTVNIALNNAIAYGYTLNFNPKDNVIFYSASFSIVAISSTSYEIVFLEQYYLTPIVLSNNSRLNTSNSEIFTVVSPVTLANVSFQVRNYISCLQSYQSTGQVGVTINPISTFINGSNQFTITASIQLGSLLSQITITSIIINKDALLLKHALYINPSIDIYKNYTGISDKSFSLYTTSNFSIPLTYGPAIGRNCTIGFYGIRISADSSAKAMLISYATSTITYNQISGCGILGNYYAFCIVDCDSDAFYYTPLSICQYCRNHITYCLQCTSNSYCTNCGVNTIFDNTTKHCRCKFGNFIQGGCTTITGCLKIDNNGLCTQCLTGFVLTGSYLCQCTIPGYSLVTDVCTNIYGCITAAKINSTIRCFACNMTLHLKSDHNGGCVCIEGFTIINGICSTICGNGQLFGIEQCDDGNHFSGDGCSSLCQVQTSYQCLSNSTSSSICAYKAQFAEITLVQAYRDRQQNAGFFIFKVQPAISNLNKMNFRQSLKITCPPTNILQPTIEYDSGILKIKVHFQSDIQSKEMNITLKFNQTIIIHKPIQAIFDIRSLNAPMIVFSKFPEYDFVSLYLKIISLLAVVIFLISLWVHKMIGIETIHIFQFIFFTTIYQVSYKDLFISAMQSLRYSSNYPDPFYDQMTNIKEGDIFQSLMFSFTFVGNYYIIGTIQIIAVSGFVVMYFKKIFEEQREISVRVYQQQQQELQEEQETEKQMTFKLKYQKIYQTLYSIVFFPFVIGFYYQCFFAVQAQLYRKELSISKMQQIINSILTIFFTWLASYTIFKQLFFNMKQTIKSQFYNVQNRYISMYTANILFNLIFFNFSDRFQYDLTSFVSYNFIYFLIILAYRPYKHHLHNFHILYNQLLFILWIIFLIYQDRAIYKLSDEKKYNILMGLVSALSLTLLIAIFRIILQVSQNGSQKIKIQKYFDYRVERQKKLREKSNLKIKKIMENDLENMKKYRLKDQQQFIRNKQRECINAQKNAIGLRNLYQIKGKAVQMQREKTLLIGNESRMHNDDHDYERHYQTKKQAEIQELKARLRQNLLYHKRKRYQLQQQQ